MKDYQCSCYVEYPNRSHKNKNGTWKCVDKYEKCESWKPNSIYGCKTHCRRKEAKEKEMNEDTKTYNGHTYSGNLLSACVNGYKQGIADERAKTLKQVMPILLKIVNEEGCCYGFEKEICDLENEYNRIIGKGAEQ